MPEDMHSVVGERTVEAVERVAVGERIIEAVERLMVEAVGITTVALGQASPGIELSLPQWRALVVVGASDGGIRVGEIAARIGSAVPSTSRLIRRLERRGLLAAERDEADRRATVVSLTPLGERIRKALVERRRELVRAALAGRPPLPAALAPALCDLGDALRCYE